MTNYDKEIKKLRAEIRLKIKHKKKRSHLLEKLEKLERAKKRASKKKPVKKVRPKKKVAKKPKKKVAKKPKKKVTRKPRKKKPKLDIIDAEPIVEPYFGGRVEFPVEESPPDIPVRFIDLKSGSEQMYSEPGIPSSGDHFMMSSNANRKELSGVTIGGVERVADVFENAFERALSKGSFEASDVAIYQYGAVFRPRNAPEISEDVREKIGEIIKDIPGAVVHVVDEDGTHSIRIGIGSAREFVGPEKVSDDLRERAYSFDSILEYLDSVYGDTEWFAFWDTEESMYD